GTRRPRVRVPPSRQRNRAQRKLGCFVLGTRTPNAGPEEIEGRQTGSWARQRGGPQRGARKATREGESRHPDKRIEPSVSWAVLFSGLEPRMPAPRSRGAPNRKLGEAEGRPAARSQEGDERRGVPPSRQRNRAQRKLGCFVLGTR